MSQVYIVRFGPPLVQLANAGWFISSTFLCRFGVGGEYPMAAGSAAERAEAGGREMAKKRGREVR